MKMIMPDRPYQLFFEHRPDCLYVYVGSEINSLEIATRYWIEILSVLHRRGYTRVLIEKDIAQSLALHDVFTLVSQLAHTGHRSHVSFAIYDHYYETERCGFEQLVGTNRGLNLKIFGTFGDAETWLSHQRPRTNIIKPAKPMHKQTLMHNAVAGGSARA